MFSQISWSSYLITIFLLSAVYYLVIGYLYYRYDLLQLFRTAKNDVAEPAQKQPALAQAFVHEVQVFMHEAGKNKLEKKDIIGSLPLLLKKYPALVNSASREAFQNLIINECSSYCSIDLSDEELRAIWI